MRQSRVGGNIMKHRDREISTDYSSPASLPRLRVSRLSVWRLFRLPECRASPIPAMSDLPVRSNNLIAYVKVKPIGQPHLTRLYLFCIIPISIKRFDRFTRPQRQGSQVRLSFSQENSRGVLFKENSTDHDSRSNALKIHTCDVPITCKRIAPAILASHSP